MQNSLQINNQKLKKKSADFFLIDIKKEGLKKTLDLLLKNKEKEIILIEEIFPIKNNLHQVNIVIDHVNLTGENILKGGKFIAVNDIYKTKVNLKKHFNIADETPQITVACIKNGVIPNKKEIKKLLEVGISAYCYNIAYIGIYAAYLGVKINVVGITSS